MSDLIPVFDGHNDVLLRLARRGGSAPERAFLRGEATGHLDLPRMRAGGFVGGFFAVFVPSPDDDPRLDDLMTTSRYDLPLPKPLDLPYAQRATLHMVSTLMRLVRASDGALRLCRTAAEIRAAMEAGAVAVVLHIEGAEAIDPDFRMLEVLHAAGLRSIGPVWSRPNLFGHGVPFRFPAGPDIGPGLTDHGRALIRLCNELKIMVDLSHLNEKGFWEVAALSKAPLVATHSNAHALSPHSRNLTDRQLAAIRDTGGVVGINFATSFLRADGRKDANTPLEDVARHLDHLIARVGPDGVALGSDFDGATIPAAIRDAAGLPRLINALRKHGFDAETLAKVAHGNWIRVLERTWGA
jgi:membrane dipeptidase